MVCETLCVVKNIGDRSYIVGDIGKMLKDRKH